MPEYVLQRISWFAITQKIRIERAVKKTLNIIEKESVRACMEQDTYISFSGSAMFFLS